MSLKSDAQSGTRIAAAQAQPNIALIKYWGKRDLALNLPVVGSLSITLDTLWTRTEVRFDPGLDADRMTLNGREDARQLRRASHCLDLLRARAGVSTRAHILSTNNFPTGAGLASSASGFAALVLAADAALGLNLPRAVLSVLARRCSGSAARSIFGGYVEWAHGERADGEDSVARPILDAASWPLNVAVAITSTAEKAIGSTEGMNRTADTSPYQRAWIETQDADLAEARAAIVARDFERLADISEHSCLKMHALALAAKPGLLYWNAATVAAMHRVRQLRAQGLPVFFTIDAGPQLKAVCLPSASAAVATALREVPGVIQVVETGLGGDATCIDVAEAVAA